MKHPSLPGPLFPPTSPTHGPVVHRRDGKGEAASEDDGPDESVAFPGWSEVDSHQVPVPNPANLYTSASAPGAREGKPSPETIAQILEQAKLLKRCLDVATSQLPPAEKAKLNPDTAGYLRRNELMWGLRVIRKDISWTGLRRYISENKREGLNHLEGHRIFPCTPTQKAQTLPGRSGVRRRCGWCGGLRTL